jgi:hypothetical protein
MWEIWLKKAFIEKRIDKIKEEYFSSYSYGFIKLQISHN